MHQNIGFHTRLYGNNSVKVTGGSFGGPFSIETANRLVKGHQFTVVCKPSGTPVFVDREGREVTLYFSVDPRDTDAGKAAMAVHLAEREQLAKVEEEKRTRIEALLDSMSNDEVLSRLLEEK
jgi:hypothetical protein